MDGSLRSSGFTPAFGREEAALRLAFIARAKVRAYPRSNGNGNDNGKSNSKSNSNSKSGFVVEKVPGGLGDV
jgi:hypothetical protein